MRRSWPIGGCHAKNKQNFKAINYIAIQEHERALFDQNKITIPSPQLMHRK
jgi:hypothetical protein